MSRMSTHPVGRGWWFRAGMAGLVAGGATFGGATAAQAESGWASHNVYRCQTSGSDVSNRQLIRNVGACTSGSQACLSYVREDQSYDGSGCTRDVQVTDLSRDVTDLGGIGVLAAFDEGGDPSWVCQQLAGSGFEHGALTSDE